MKKFLYLLILFGIIWLVKISYDTYLLSKQLTGIQETLHQSEQKNAMLNDQLVALQRGTVQPATQPLDQSQSQSKVSSAIVLETTPFNPTLLLKQELRLIQFALDQQQYVYALEQLNHFDFKIEEYAVAETLKQTLHQAAEHDRKMIQSYVQTRHAKVAQLDDILQQLDMNLKAEQNNTELNMTNPPKVYFWQKWFKIDHIAEQTPELMNRKLILKELQVRVLLAQQALSSGQFLEYQNILDLMISELDALPDQFSQKLKLKLQNLKQTQMQPIPKLSSAAILES
ncbi:hypothetical protein AMD27_01130 [Acinetobacter sp. TGL-Y2]|uniref:hypothetical protein n=1 Tax=Acinetobacter sp. TGL-Y2 TaxID=1407071 RepID=UPI0007A66EAC|nr:hypothetical protein [Acinetobacter sp. TGL-Y2]AMW77639.1 hypothetical protein AMD27_01130 [Acinetobacter sp. TGL-Y2]